MKVFTNKKGQVTGWLNNRTYFKEVNSRIHKMRIYQAYGIDEDIVEQLKGNCDKIRLKEKDTKRIYEVPFDVFMSKSFVKNWETTQRFLPIKEWTVEDTTQKLFYV